MIFHDVGKGHGHDHDETRRAHDARRSRDRLGLNEDERAACEFLVQHHLLMSHLAQRRDIARRPAGDRLLPHRRQRREPAAPLRAHLRRHARGRRRTSGTTGGTRWSPSCTAAPASSSRRASSSPRIARRAPSASVPACRSAAPPERRDAVQHVRRAMPDSYFLSTPEELIAGHGELRRRFERARGGGRAAGGGDPADAPSRSATSPSSRSARATGPASSRCCRACSRRTA